MFSSRCRFVASSCDHIHADHDPCNYSKINSSMCIKQYIQVLKMIFFFFFFFFFFRNISEENQETDTGLTNTNNSTRKRERTSFLKKMEPLRFCS